MKIRLRNGQRANRFVAAAVAGLIAPGLASAFEAQLGAPGAPESLENRLRAGSLTMTLAADDNTEHTSGEIIAAARSDYATLISLLYDAGYFGPEVHILVDGREAADIPPLGSPDTINQVSIIITTGRQFTFGQAEIGPLPPDTTLPEGFRSGEPAGTRGDQRNHTSGSTPFVCRPPLPRVPPPPAKGAATSADASAINGKSAIARLCLGSPSQRT